MAERNRLIENRLDQSAKELLLARECILLGVEDLLFLLLEGLRDEAFTVGRGLLAKVVPRHEVELLLGDHDEITED